MPNDAPASHKYESKGEVAGGGTTFTPSSWQIEVNSERDKQQIRKACEPSIGEKIFDAIRSPFLIPTTAGGDESLTARESYRLQQRERITACEKQHEK